jgi:hypothetical protein
VQLSIRRNSGARDVNQAAAYLRRFSRNGRVSRPLRRLKKYQAHLAEVPRHFLPVALFWAHEIFDLTRKAGDQPWRNPNSSGAFPENTGWNPYGLSFPAIKRSASEFERMASCGGARCIPIVSSYLAIAEDACVMRSPLHTGPIIAGVRAPASKTFASAWRTDLRGRKARD